jgi:hypothetical protein
MRDLFFEEQIIQRAECTVFFNLVNGHLLAVDRQFNEASPAIILVGSDLADILGVAIWTTHVFSPYPI